jgi:sulfide:quinone oxidoreductase
MQGPVKIDEGVSATGQITPADVAEIAKAGFGAIINNRPDGEEPGQPTKAAVEAEAKKHGLEYRYIPVTTSTITYKDVAALHNALLRGAKPALIHCRSGARSYVLWALTRVFFDGESPLMLAADAAKKGYDLRALPALVEKLQAEKDKG